MHLELVGDLTTDSLLGALTRFCARRGTPAEIWSDNATHFHRADIYIRHALAAAPLDWAHVAGNCAARGIEWHFIPPAAPHFGGIWEAGVKSFKGLLKRTVGRKNLTYEEMNTLLASIESVLNGRPIVPLSGDIDDLDALTPSHFLVGRPLTSVPETIDPTCDTDRLAHWALVKGLRARFWERWSREYLNTLQQRTKWTTRHPNLRAGDLVVILDSSLLRPDGRWPLGRVLQVHPGPDGHVRAGTVRTAFGEYVRPFVRLSKLPITGSTARGPDGPPGSDSD